MISREEIRKIATKFQTSEYNVAQEYCQHIFLMNFYQNKNSEQVLFKGGTSLRIVFDSPRFSEDLDFSSDLSVPELESLLVSTLKKIDNFGIKIEVKESKKTSGGYLAIFICHLSHYSVRLQMEVSKRKKKEVSGEIFTIASEFITPYTLFNLKTEDLIREKIKATLHRKKPRDFFDIYFILRSRLMPIKQKKHLKEIKELAVNSKINFSTELKKFLPVSFHPLIKNFKQTLIGEINRNA